MGEARARGFADAVAIRDVLVAYRKARRASSATSRI
jgi:hypothetical protein